MAGSGPLSVARRELEFRDDPTSVESQVRQWGHRLFRLSDAAEPKWFHQQALRGALMNWAMQNEHFKTQLFRFVDVLPSLHASSEISRHFHAYLQNGAVPSSTVRLALQASRIAPALFGMAVKSQVRSMARQFMLGDSDSEIVTTLRRRRQRHIGFTLDVLGETVVSEDEADRYAQRYLHLIHLLAGAPQLAASSVGSAPHPEWNPPLNFSIKMSALCSQILSTNPERARECIAARLRPILRRATEAGALVNLDMEQFALKSLTLDLFRHVFAEPEFALKPACGLALQAYLRDSEGDLLALIEWARSHQRPVTIRLVKGAYWDCETVIAAQRGWPVPVFAEKHESDANYEKLSRILLESQPLVRAAFGTHNVRSIAHALAQAERLNLAPTILNSNCSTEWQTAPRPPW